MRIDRARRRLIDTIGFSGRKVWQSCKDHGYANSLLYFSKVGATPMKRIQLICYRFRYVLCGLEFLFGLIWLVTVHVVRANPDHRTSQYPESMGLSMSGVPTFMSMSQKLILMGAWYGGALTIGLLALAYADEIYKSTSKHPWSRDRV
jgi:hypothetical protein